MYSDKLAHLQVNRNFLYFHCTVAHLWIMCVRWIVPQLKMTSWVKASSQQLCLVDFYPNRNLISRELFTILKKVLSIFSLEKKSIFPLLWFLLTFLPSLFKCLLWLWIPSENNVLLRKLFFSKLTFETVSRQSKKCGVIFFWNFFSGKRIFFLVSLWFASIPQRLRCQKSFLFSHSFGLL